MVSWLDTLASFAAAIRAGERFAPGTIHCPRYPEARGVEVYRNNYRGNLHDALASAYPVTRQLVGDEFFRLLARRHVERHPSRSANLHDYGGAMAALVEELEQTRPLPYLSDMARLEWAYHRAYFAADLPPFDFARLATLARDTYGDLLWRLQPECTLLASPYPIAAIWQAHQDGSIDGARIELDGAGEALLVYRKRLQVEISRIAPAAHHWLTQLGGGVPLGTATAATLAAYADFDVAGALQHWVGAGVLVDFHAPTAIHFREHPHELLAS